MNKNNVGNTIRGGGKLFRLFLFALFLPTFGSAQLLVNYTGSAVADVGNGRMDATITATLTNTGNADIDTLTWVFWPNAYKAKGTDLAKEFLEDQNAKMRFAEPEQLGNFMLFWEAEHDEFSTDFKRQEITSEVFKMPLRLKKGTTVAVRFILAGALPDAAFTGFGVDENGIQLSHWLPEIAADQNAPVTNSRNRESWTVPATFDIDFSATQPMFCFTNLGEVKSQPATNWHFKSTIPLRDALIILQKESSIFKIAEGNDSLSLHFKGSFPAFNQLTSWAKISAFLQSEWGYKPQQNVHFLFLDKKGLQSSENLILLPSSTQTDDIEASIVEQFVSVLAREKLSINPAKHPWLVEGLAAYYKQLFYQEYYPEKRLLGPLAQTAVARFFDVDHYPIRYQNRMMYLYMSRQGLDQPLSDPTTNYSRANRQAVITGKSTLVFSYLRNYTGDRNFKRSMQYWLQNSVGENNPETLLAAIRFYHNQDVSWFLGDLYSTNKKLDYKLKKTENCTSVYTATIKNKGDLAIPYPVTGYKNGKPLLTEWFAGHPKSKTVQIHLEEYQKVKIDGQESMPEYTQKNNTVRTSGLFKTMQPLKLQFYTSFENPNKTQIFWLPSLKYNAYDKFLIGAQFYNTTIFRKPFEYRISPDYSTGTGKITGMASFRFNWTPHNSVFHLVSLALYGRYYHYAENLAYTRLSPTLTLNFKKSSPRSEWIRTLRLRTVLVDKEEPQPGSDISPLAGTPNYRIVDLQYKAEKGSLLNPLIAIADAQFATDFIKLSGEFKQRWRLTKNHLLTARLFAGYMIPLENNVDPYFQFGLSGTRDYLFDYYLIGRSDQSGIWSQQFFVSDGGFKSQTETFTNAGLLSMSVNVPFYRFVGAFADAAALGSTQNLAWDYGLYLELIPDFIEVYFPLQSSFGNHFNNPNYQQQIRFVLNLELDSILNRVRRGFY